VRVDRAKAALFGVSATAVANTIRTNVSGTQAATFRQNGKEFPIIVRLREDERQHTTDVEDVLISTPQGQVLPAKNLMKLETTHGPVQIERKNQQRITFVNAEPEVTLSEAVEAINSAPRLARPDAAPRLQRRVRRRGRAAGAGLQPAPDGPHPGPGARLRRDGLAV
jgi:multidrug efflux pump subunit AcrB